MFKKNDNNKLCFLNDNDILYRKKMNDENTSFVFKRICVFQFMMRKILTMTYDESNKHIEFDRVYDRLINS